MSENRGESHLREDDKSSGAAERHANDDTSGGLDRRKLVTLASIALAGIGAALAGLPVVGFILAPLFREEAEEWRPVGRVDDFPIGETLQVEFLEADPMPWAGFVAKTSAWVRRERDEEFIAFSIYCTHLGCPVRWEADAELFMCPCHGGMFYRDGTVASGPPSRPLVPYPVRVRDGVVAIRTASIPLTG